MKLRKVLVTGADGALGGAVVTKFLEAECEVFGTYFQHVPKMAAKSLHWIQMDVSRTESIQAGCASIGELDALIHCAGGFAFAKTEELTDKTFDFLLNTNLRSAFLLAREVLPGMKKRGFGRLVFVGAKATQLAGAGMGAYAASKAGLNSLTTALADEVRAWDINVNAVLPSIIDTEANRGAMPKADFSTWVARESLAEIIHWLTQPASKAIHGALLPVSGRV